MSNRKVELARLELVNPEKPGTTLDVECYYDLGGPNPFSGRFDPRGYFLSVSPVTREENWKSFTAFSGIRTCLQPANRFSQKTLEQVAATALQSGLYPKLVAAVCEKNKVVLVEGQEKVPHIPTPELPPSELWGSDTPPATTGIVSGPPAS